MVKLAQRCLVNGAPTVLINLYTAIKVVLHTLFLHLHFYSRLHYCHFCDRKTAFKAKHYAIHLNLSIALLFGLIVFVSGVETAEDVSYYALYMYSVVHM